MSEMISLTMENVRCFASPISAPLAPLTLLVGENSTGKSTFLAAVRLASTLARQPMLVDFNEEPFLLGAFDDIASYREGARKKTSSFSIGLSASLSSIPNSILKIYKAKTEEVAHFVATFRRVDSQPVVSRWQFVASPYGVAFTPAKGRSVPTVEYSSPKGLCTLSGKSLEANLPVFFDIPWFYGRMQTKESNGKALRVDGPVPDEKDLAIISEIVKLIRGVLPVPPHAIAPVRTKPKRTYDPLGMSPQPEGEHVPMVLAKILSGRSKERRRLEKALNDFGKASGLFGAVKIKKLGGKGSTPFQVKLNFGGQPDFNLVDVGYGVSQALPIVVDILRAPPGSTLLIQQPEVHLHPRAQAALGSLMIQLATTEKKRFIVETHSDHLIDRVRMDIRDDENLSPEDAQILYFSRPEGTNAEIHPLELDVEGNIVDPPRGYRDFFLREEHRFIGVE